MLQRKAPLFFGHVPTLLNIIINSQPLQPLESLIWIDQINQPNYDADSSNQNDEKENGNVQRVLPTALDIKFFQIRILVYEFILLFFTAGYKVCHNFPLRFGVSTHDNYGMSSGHRVLHRPFRFYFFHCELQNTSSDKENCSWVHL